MMTTLASHPHIGSKHMRLFVLMTLFAPLPCLAQTSLTLSNNGFREGDSLVTRMVNDAQPGISGRDAVWDFSDKGTGRAHVLLYTADRDTLSAADGGTSWRTVLHGDTLWLTGFENRHTLMEYHEPLPLLRYPFSYGDSIRGSFRGMGVWCDRSYMRVWGDGVTRADGEGTLILPSGDTLRHVLRVHSVRRTWHTAYDSVRTWQRLREVVRQETREGLALETTRTIPVVSETYTWYAPGWRYPVLRMENATDGIGTAALAVAYPPEAQLDLDYDMENALLRQRLETDGSEGQPGGEDESTNPLASHSTSYNSSTNTVTVSFALSRPATVSLLLSDAAGIAWRSTEQVFYNNGTYSLSLNCAGLPHGQYALRIISGASILTSKFNV